MSKRLRQLRQRLDRQRLSTEEEQLAWLNRASFETDGLIGPDEWVETLTALARRAAGERGVGVVDAWFQVAQTVAAAVPDPDDKLYGLILAVHARDVGLRYEDPRTITELFRLFVAMREAWEQDETDDESEEAYQAYEFVTNRLMDVETALEHPLENGENVPPEMLADPAVVAAGGDLLWDVIEDRSDAAEADGGELPDDEVTQRIEYGGHYLWAAYHARRCGVDREELTAFVTTFVEWFGMMDSLVRYNSLAPGVLASLRDCVDRGAQLVEEGPELVDTWRRHHSGDLPLTEYLTQVLTAVVQDA